MLGETVEQEKARHERLWEAKKVQPVSPHTTICKGSGEEESAKKMRNSSQEKTRGQEESSKEEGVAS